MWMWMLKDVYVDVYVALDVYASVDVYVDA